MSKEELTQLLKIFLKEEIIGNVKEINNNIVIKFKNKSILNIYIY